MRYFPREESETKTKRFLEDWAKKRKWSLLQRSKKPIQTYKFMAMKAKSLAILIVCAISFLSFLHADEGGLTNGSNKPVGSPAIKGLSLGMTRNDAIEVLKKLDGSPSFEIDNFGIERLCVLKHVTIGTSDCIVPSDPSVFFDDNNNVKKIVFSGSKTSELFGTEALSSEDFAKMVIDSYKVPTLSPMDDDKGWIYVSDKGWSLAISTEHQITLSKEDVVKKMD